MKEREITVGSRGSPLALAQAKQVAQALAREGLRSRVIIIETEGDRRVPDTAWGEGAFVVAIERALLAHRIDVAVHSVKDVPTDEDPRLCLAAYLHRADPRDALVVRAAAKERRLDDLPPGSRVGTDSPRRTGFLLIRRPDLMVQPLHGNVDTRLRRLDAGDTDALVLACAGLDRMGLGDRITERLAPELVPPAPGQGAIAIQMRRDDTRMLSVAAAIDHRPTRVAVEAERAFLSASGGGCRAPIGALATVADEEIELLGGYVSPDGSEAVLGRRRGVVAAGEALARDLATELGSRERVGAGFGPLAPSVSRSTVARVLVTRAVEQADELVSALRDEGLVPVQVPTIAIEFEAPGGELDAAARRLPTYGWVVVTSANGARAIVKAAERVATPLNTPCWAAIGSETRRVVEREGVVIDFQPRRASSIVMAVDLPVARGDRVLVVRGDLADEALAVALRTQGAEVDDVVGYRTREAPSSSGPLLRRVVSDGSVDAIVFTSSSTVRGLVALSRAESIDLAAIPSVCIGPETAAEARRAGFSVLAVSATPDAARLASTTARSLAAQSKAIR